MSYSIITEKNARQAAEMILKLISTEGLPAESVQDGKRTLRAIFKRFPKVAEELKKEE